VSERMTSIFLPSLGLGSGFADWGRKTRPDMIARMRRHAQIQKEEAERILAASDEEFVVETYVGVHVRNKLEVVTE
jgi:hypothetical protein